MKNITKLLVCFCLIFFSCDVEKVGDQEVLKDVPGKTKKVKRQKDEPKIIKECTVVDADRCPIGDRQPTANFWWPRISTDHDEPSAFYSSVDGHQLTFAEYDDGTANIKGTTSNGTCVVEVDVWLIDRKSWTEWSALGGEHKKQGCAGLASNSEDMHFYVIDSERSSITASGTECTAVGTFGIEQRPDPFDASTPNLGAHVGPGGANFDSEIGAYGISTWGWVLDPETKERLYVMDFNFKTECKSDCETAFARGVDGETCFIENGFNRWGWTIGPIAEGNYTYNVHAGAGQCDISKGELVGTVDVSYQNGNVDVTYNIDPSLEVKETHTYAGNAMYPTKNGSPTVAPGQYSVTANLSGDIYVIAHAVVCKD
ncbi:hypothetical protein [uncultured Kriegella sp.]|uniref:hypothetical protein n=1 Tax=uncultured Kriegella sp. TaxID=1798910 RepID=UPI0030DC2724|tara:strand:+ start:77923 stop:79035 length:1113 start_codon:yes stop_codon:yes gene_type:complete